MLNYIIGLLITCNLLGAWFFSNFPQHVYNALLRRADEEEIYTKDDLTARVALRFGKWGDLAICPVCLGTWMSVSPAVGVILLNNASWKLLLLGPLSWPFIFFLLYTWIKTK